MLGFWESQVDICHELMTSIHGAEVGDSWDNVLQKSWFKPYRSFKWLTILNDLRREGESGHKTLWEKPDNPERPNKCGGWNLETFTKMKRVAVRFSLELLCSRKDLLSHINVLVRCGNTNQDESMTPFPALSVLESRKNTIVSPQ